MLTARLSHITVAILMSEYRHQLNCFSPSSGCNPDGLSLHGFQVFKRVDYFATPGSRGDDCGHFAFDIL